MPAAMSPGDQHRQVGTGSRRSFWLIDLDILESEVMLTENLLDTPMSNQTEPFILSGRREP
jgi:hypothetical protein